MAISVTWFDEKQRIAYIHLTPGWTWGDFWMMNESFNELASTVVHPIYLIVDMTGAGMPSQFVPELSKIASISEERPTNLQFTVVVGVGVMLETVTNIFSRLYKRATAHVRFVSTVNEALPLIESHRQTLLSSDSPDPI